MAVNVGFFGVLRASYTGAGYSSGPASVLRKENFKTLNPRLDAVIFYFCSSKNEED
jgi:hypothetical protein